MVCKIDGCNNKRGRALGLCYTHYQHDLKRRNPEFAERRKEEIRNWYAKNREKVIAHVSRYRKSHPWTPEYARERKLKSAYGLTIEDYNRMLRKQGGTCAICFRPPNGERLVVDHDHIQNKVRGLLCSRCNKGIGMLEDNPRLLSKAVTYLNMHNAAI